jgi:flagellar assembly protein FliH
MKSLEPIRFAHPLREVTLARAGALPIDWENQLESAERAGYERGLIDGEKALSEQLLRQRNELLELHNGAVEAMRNAVPQVIQQSEDALITLAFEIAQKVVSDLPITRESIAATVREALSQVEGATEFNIQLNPADFALLENNTALIGAAPEQQMHFAPSRDVTRGGCLVQTRFGIIDARRETKLSRIAESLGVTK